MNTKYLILPLLSLALTTAAFASTQKIQCKDSCPANSQDGVGCDEVKFEVSGDNRGDVVWINASNDSETDQGSITLQKEESKKHPGYAVYSGVNADESAGLYFELPKSLVGKSAPAHFTGYFYDLENDGGPDVPLGFTMKCSIE